MKNRFLSARWHKRVKEASREVGIFFPVILSLDGYRIFFRKKTTLKKKKKNFPPSRPFLAHSGSGQETTFYLRVALV